jgi:DNA-binding NtrC family response regulator
MKHSALPLVSFSAVQDAEPLRAMLETLGHRVEMLTTQDLARNGARIFSPTVLFLGPDADQHQRDVLLAFLRQSPTPVCLGVVARSGGVWDSEILGYCGEFVAWPCTAEELALRFARLSGPRDDKAAVDEVMLEQFAALNLVGRSPAFARALEQIKKLARYDVSVLIQGETGTGKELAARAVHYLSARRNAAFVPVNCGAIPDNLLENELFGHERGAFTDAKDAQAGLVVLAEGGTLFLDEIETLSPKAQVVLLRFLQDRSFRALGGRRQQQANVRVIAAGNEDLAESVKRGRFREDLYFRLNLGLLNLPALRERRGDVRLLAEHFCGRYRQQYSQPEKNLHPGSLHQLEQYDWPGNVRELENMIHREFLFTDESAITLRDAQRRAERRQNLLDRRLAPLLRATLRNAKGQFVSEFEKSYLSALLEKTRGNVTLAAREAGTERRALGKLLKKHGIPASRFRSA